MKELKICIGSACHLKGSYGVIECFKKMLETYHLEEKLELCGSFCTGHCTQAVSVMRWDGTVYSVSEENAKDIFIKEIMANL